MSTNDVTTILVELRSLKEDVAEVKQLAAATNGRVRKLELWRAGIEGARAALSWRVPAALAVLSAIAGATAAALIGG